MGVARRTEGTTLGGYRCDRDGCDANGAWTPVLCVPYEGYPVEIRKPLIGMVDTHVCIAHHKDVRMGDVISKQMKDVIEDTAALDGGRPDFKRAWLAFVPTNCGEYLDFQHGAGLVPRDDAMVKGSMN